MADEAIPLAVSLPAVADSADAVVMRPEEAAAEVKDNGTNGDTASIEPAKEGATEPAAQASPAAETKAADSTNDKPAASPKSSTEDKPAADAQMEDIKADERAPATAESSTVAADTSVTPAPADKFSKARRKSSGVPEHKSKKLNKKASKAKMTHTDAKPGDYFMIRLKGYPLWPGIVCDESMLPNTLLKNRPVTAANKDGEYRADYADGGAKVNDRTFPVMYLHTNEFGWIPNTDLLEVDFDTIGTFPPSMRKDLQQAHLLAAEQHDLEYFKEILQNFMEQRAEIAAAKETAKAEKKKAAKEGTKAKPRKSLSKAAVDEDDNDVEMEDPPVEPDSDGAEVAEKPKKTKKRKPEDDGETPQRIDSVKKTKIKLTTTPKPNGAATSKAVKETAPKIAKAKAKKAAAKEKSPEEIVLKEPELSPEEKRQKKEKEILFLRHKLQKGLLSKDQTPKEDEMKQMAEFVTKLEGYADLEVSIIRATKINKVLKAIIKLSSIPKEEDYNFKSRSQTLLDKWNTLLASDTPSAATNGGEDAHADADDNAAAPKTINGVKDEEKVEDEVKEDEEEKTEVKAEAAADEESKVRR
ncbi:hypothetical protein BJ878DRAFT_337988 [Calycina marina]|uniref:PWWP domain-containing protein n=1 Tax=Calycina marina TaxID=1763456 RepID=A0A9P8CFZ5_9HELO|nr:hypothetical protein BJ878DRAFT_337988 [Calycina marina]